MAQIMPIIRCNGVHPGETMNPEEMGLLLERIGGTDPFDVPVCTRPGRKVDGVHTRLPYPILSMIDTGELAELLTIMLAAAANTGESEVTLWVSDEMSPYYPHLELNMSWDIPKPDDLSERG
jgi:hypothetical protein